MLESLGCFLVVVGLSEGFTPSASAGGVGLGVNGNLVDRTWDPVEPSAVASYYPGPRPAGPQIVHSPPNFGLSMPPVTSPSCWTTPSVAGAAVISVLALGAILATKLPLILLAPAILTLLALPLALPLLAPVLALAFMLPMPTDDSSPEDMSGMMNPPDDPKKPTTGDTENISTPARRLWDTMNNEGQQCLQKVACQLGRHAGNTGVWVMKKLPESEWGSFQKAYLEGSRSNNQSDNACVKFQCSVKGAFEAMSAASSLPGTL